jgi:hypothetical protein
MRSSGACHHPNFVEGGKSMDNLNDWIPVISNLGFPIFVSWYLLTKVDSRIEALSASISEMTAVLSGWKKEA